MQRRSSEDELGWELCPREGLPLGFEVGFGLPEELVYIMLGVAFVFVLPWRRLVLGSFRR